MSPAQKPSRSYILIKVEAQVFTKAFEAQVYLHHNPGLKVQCSLHLTLWPHHLYSFSSSLQFIHLLHPPLELLASSYPQVFV